MCRLAKGGNLLERTLTLDIFFCNPEGTDLLCVPVCVQRFQRQQPRSVYSQRGKQNSERLFSIAISSRASYTFPFNLSQSLCLVRTQEQHELLLR